MPRPGWCPCQNCHWMTGGGESDDSGSFCGGQMPEPATHLGTTNTHRFCIRQACDEEEIISLQVNRTDVWYIGRFFRLFLERMEK